MLECHTGVHEAVSMETTIVKSIKSEVFTFTERLGGSISTHTEWVKVLNDS